mmetsp:Transcript_121407/g.315152  ORF Transcript_121407/g.315152 Transcript_121407/m.315152 type:complete len:256 (-) Transcript_121407:354-1121(-)
MVHVQALAECGQARGREAEAAPMRRLAAATATAQRKAEVPVRLEVIALERKRTRERQVQAKASGPNIGGLRQRLAQENLRRHVVRGASHREYFILRRLSGYVEVDKLEVSEIGGDQHILCLDIAMQDAIPVQVADGVEQGSEEGSSDALYKPSLFRASHSGLQAHASEGVQHKDCAHGVGEEIMRANNVAVHDAAQELELLAGIVQVLLVVHAHNFERHLLAVLLPLCRIDDTGAALAQGLEQIVPLREPTSTDG